MDRVTRRKGMQVSSGRVAGEQGVVDDVRVDDAWSLVEEFSGLVRESGTDEEREAVRRIASRLARWGVRHDLYEPEVLISLPLGASLKVNGVTHAAKTPSMARSTGPAGQTAPLVYEPSSFAGSVHDIFAAAGGAGDVRDRFVLTEGLPMPGKVADLEARGAAGAVFISPGERIHEGICTSIWGSPDLTSWQRKPRIPVISVSNSVGRRLADEARVAGAVTATVVAEHDERWRPIPVVVAEIPGTEEPDRFVLVHGHLDSWHVGIGDNATGDATLLEVARVLSQHRQELKRTVRVAWWSGHSHGRYAGSAWYADSFANDLLRNCICHVNCDSPGCRDANIYSDVYWMAEVEEFAKGAVRDITSLEAEGGRPIRAGDISFNNLGLSTFFMLTSTMPEELRRERNLYAVGGCGGNIEWHTEADTMEVADRDNLLRDMRMYAGAVFRAANLPVHPLDFRATVDQLTDVLRGHAEELDGLVELDETLRLAEKTRDDLERFYSRLDAVRSVAEARSINDSLLRIGRSLVSVLYSKEGRFRQDPALDAPLLPALAEVIAAKDVAPEGVLRTESMRARNRVDSALRDTIEECAKRRHATVASQ
jgi:N-acetylated-alpha-linked acidic dipeptidase